MSIRRTGPAIFAWSLLLVACDAAPPVFEATDRAVGDRTPLERGCDDVDPTRCLLPWPSNAFTIADPTTATGLRLSVDLSTLNRQDEGAEALARADGFSRVSSLVVGFPAKVDLASLGWASADEPGAIHLLLAQHDHPDVGAEVPLRVEVVPTMVRGLEESVVVAHPLVPLEAGADYVVVVTDELRSESGMPVPASRGSEVALGRVAPATQAEADLRGYHAATRAFLEAQGIDASHLLRAWDFTTRSSEDPLRRLRAMRQAALEAVAAGEVGVEIDVVEHRAEGPVATVVEGRLSGLPDFLEPDGGIAIEPDGAPRRVGLRDAPFRIVIPRGTGDYRFLMYGHGTGGNVRDDAFDRPITTRGAAKVGIQYHRWTDDTVIDTFVGLQNMVMGASFAAGGLVQAVADASAVQAAMGGVLGEALAAESLGGMPNPHVGRRPDGSVPVWVGGSLGGTMGLVYAAANPEVRHAVLNVPGAAWGTWVRDALQFGLFESLVRRNNGGDENVALAVAIAQTLLDEADGASWADVLREQPFVALVQESIYDPVLPNPGTAMVAEVLDAAHVGPVLVPIVGRPQLERTVERSGLTQYHVVSNSALEVHGFAAQDTPAAAAAQEQILGFVEGAWAGSATIEFPSGCTMGTPDGSCDFAPDGTAPTP
jgi:pimeloyl-ACP methyl ester carboxylesterase